MPKNQENVPLFDVFFVINDKLAQSYIIHCKHTIEHAGTVKWMYLDAFPLMHFCNVLVLSNFSPKYILKPYTNIVIHISAGRQPGETSKHSNTTDINGFR